MSKLDDLISKAEVRETPEVTDHPHEDNYNVPARVDADPKKRGAGSISHSAFVTKHNGKFLNFDNAYGAQCVDLARFYWQDVLGVKQPRGVSGAKDFWANYTSDPNLNQQFDRITNTETFVPKAGDTMIWKHGEFGHIAIVATDNNDTNYFTAFSQNDPLNSPCKLVKYNYNNVFGVFRKKGGDVACLISNDEAGRQLHTKLVHNSSLADQMVKFLELGNNADNVSYETFEKSMRARNGKLTECQTLLATRESELAKTRTEVENRKEQLSRLEASSLKEKEVLNAEITKLKLALSKPDEMAEKWKAAYEQEHSSFLAEAKLKGEALTQLAEVKTQLENCQKGTNAPTKSLWDWLRDLLQNTKVSS